MEKLRGSSPSQRFYKGGGGQPLRKFLLNFMAVTILANPETLDVAKKSNFHT